MTAVSRGALPGCRLLFGMILAGTACGYSPPAPTSTPVDILAGAYVLTIEFPPACVTVPELSVPRSYHATLEPSVGYLGITIAGGGYAEPRGIGDLWAAADGRVARLEWNTAEVPCDGTPEPLPAGRALSICGKGSGTFNARTILADMSADVFIDEGGQRLKVCRHTAVHF